MEAPSLPVKKRWHLYSIFAVFSIIGCGFECSISFHFYINLILIGFLLLKVSACATWIQFARMYYEVYLKYTPYFPHSEERWKVYFIASAVAAVSSAAALAVGFASFIPGVHLPLLVLNQVWAASLYALIFTNRDSD